MAEVADERWAKDVWGDKAFAWSSSVQGETAIVTRRRSDSDELLAMERGGSWQKLPYALVPDDVVDTITWLTVVPHQPMLVEIMRNGRCTFRMLLTTDAPRLIRRDGSARWSETQISYMMAERIKVVTGCSTKQALQLKAAVRDKHALQIIQFAAYLLKNYEQAHDAVKAIEQLWRCAPEDIRSIIPQRFHVITEKGEILHHKVHHDLVRCVSLMAPWQLHA